MSTPTTTEESPSRLRQAEQRAARTAKADAASQDATAEEDVVRAEQRFARFRSKYKEGVHDAEIVEVIQHANGHVTFVVKASVWTSHPYPGDVPNATAFAARSTADDDPISAANPLATADTVARSRALRNLGILVNPTKPRKPRTPKD